MMRSLIAISLVVALASAFPTARTSSFEYFTGASIARRSYTSGSTYNSGYTSSSAYTSSSGYTSGSTTYNTISASLTMVGSSNSAFSATAQSAFKTAVAMVSTDVTSTGVSITSSSRRDTTVAFTVNFPSSGSASTQQTSLGNYLVDSTFLSNLQSALSGTGFSVTGITGVSVGGSTYTADTGGSSSSGLSTGAIVGIVIACVVGVAIIVALIYYFAFANKSHAPTSGTTIQRTQDNNEIIADAGSNDKVIDDKTVSI